MNSKVTHYLVRWLVTTVAVLIAANVVKGIHYTGFPALMVASLVLGLAYTFVRPVLMVIGIGFVIATLGLGIFVINALLLWGVGSLGTGFRVDGFWPALWGGLIISTVSFIANLFLGKGPKVTVQKNRRESDDDETLPPGNGPVIDV